jgi:benzoyl-CoA reductase/2-hydroxyglutaryl-CoA dehydratase subunit BcrC/BadD/HgdB
MNQTNIADKQKNRFLKSIARRTTIELEKLRQIPESPPALNYFYDAMESVFVRNEPERFLNPDSTKKKMIGVYCMMVPEELIDAAGAVSVRLCAGCFESSQIGEDRIPRDVCPLVKSAMGFTIQKGLAAVDLCDVVIVPATCDAKRKLGEELSAFKNVWMIEVPHIKDAEFSRRIWIDQLYGLKSKIEKYAGNGRAKTKTSSRYLGAAIKKTAVAQWELRQLLSIRQSKSPVIWGRQAVVVENAYAYTRTEDWADNLAQLNIQLAKKVKHNNAVCSENCPRIFIAGSPVIFPNTKIQSLVEEMGGIVVADESCAGDRYLYDPVGNPENSLAGQMTGIASRYLAPCICPAFTPNDDRLFMIKRMVADFAADGVLYHVLKGCVIYDFELHRVEKILNRAKIPVLRIETDYNPEDVEQLRTRIEAFIEMLKSQKKKKRSDS